MMQKVLKKRNDKQQKPEFPSKPVGQIELSSKMLKF